MTAARPKTSTPFRALAGFARGVLLALPLLSASLLASPDANLKSQLEVMDTPIARSADNAYRVVFVGTSITRHGTSADIRRNLGWGHVAGMAASRLENDYVHLLADRIQKKLTDRAVEIYYDTQAPRRPLPSDAGRELRSATVANKLYHVESLRTFRPHLVVLQLGEHDRDSLGADGLRAEYTALLDALQRFEPRTDVIAVGVWAPGDAKAGRNYYTDAHWPGVTDRVMREVCAEKGVPFASVRDYANDPDCRGWGESPGVKWHPNDRGMAGYATVLFSAFESLRPRPEAGLPRP